jgi:uncharacterized protein RhaS with RHS repeats
VIKKLYDAGSRVKTIRYTGAFAPGTLVTNYLCNGLGQRLVKNLLGGEVAADAVRAVPVNVTNPNINYIYTDHLDTPRVITRSTDNRMVWRWDHADP